MNRDNPIIHLQNVGLYYSKRHSLFSFGGEKRWALKDVSLQLSKGETLGVVGRNGSGKSTLLSLIAGILKPDRGRIDIRVRKISLLSLQVGFMPELSGHDNIIVSGLLSGYTRHEILEKKDDIISFSGLQECINDPIHTYSPGMRARLGFAIAFFTDPDVMLVDETLGVGDARFQEKSSQKMKDRIKSNKTVVLVSHNHKVIEELCDRVIWIENGVNVMEGRTDDIIAAYKDALRRSRNPGTID